MLLNRPGPILLKIDTPLSLPGIKATIQRAISQREGIRHDDLDALAGRARRGE